MYLIFLGALGCLRGGEGVLEREREALLGGANEWPYTDDDEADEGELLLALLLVGVALLLCML